MASTNTFLTLVSTVQTNNIGSTISTGYIPYVSTAGRQTYSSTLSSLTISTLFSSNIAFPTLNASNMTTSTIVASTISTNSMAVSSISTSGGIIFPNGYIQNSSAIGYGQSYVDKTSSRSIASGNVYTNNTGRPIFVMVSVYGNDGSTTQVTGYIYINGVTIYQKQTISTYNGADFSTFWNVQFIVPPGATYQVYAYISYFGGSPVLVYWYELS